MTNKLSAVAALVAVTALTPIRYNGERRVPGSRSASFEADAKTAHNLVSSGAAEYDDPEQAAPDGTEGGNTATGSEGAGSEAHGGGQVATNPAPAATATDRPAAPTKAAAKSAPAKKTAAKKK